LQEQPEQRLWPTLGYYIGTYLQGLSKAMTNLLQYCRCPEEIRSRYVPDTRQKRLIQNVTVAKLSFCRLADPQCLLQFRPLIVQNMFSYPHQISLK